MDISKWRTIVSKSPTTIVPQHNGLRGTEEGPYLTHEFLCGEDKLVVDDPSRPLLIQTAVGVDEDTLLVFHRLVGARLPAESRRMVEETGRHRLQVTTASHTSSILLLPSYVCPHGRNKINIRY